MTGTRRTASILAVFSLILLSSAARPQLAPDKAPPRYTIGASKTPGGSGKFYMGREIAQVMGHQGAAWLERPQREKEEQPKRLLKLLDLKPGLVVADLGAGSGYHSFRIAEKVGARGKVLAVDIQKEMLDIIRGRMKKEEVTNIEPVLGTEKDPKLPAAGVDLVLLVDVYHEFAYPHEMMQSILKALKPGGRIVFVEFREEDREPEIPILPAHRMTKKQVLAEMDQYPLKHLKTISSLPWQHVIIFEKKSPPPRKDEG